MKKLITTILLLLSFCVAMTACQSVPSGEAASVTEKAESAWPMTLTDQAGRTTVIPKQPERIVSGYYISTSTLIALGLKDKILGIEAKADQRNIYRLSAPELISLPCVGTARAFDVEGCAALSPDLVILPLKLSDAADVLTGLGIPVLLVNPENSLLAGEMIDLIAAAAGVTGKAAELKAYQQKIRDRLAALSGNEPLVYIGSNSDLLRTAGKNMYQAEMIRLAGCRNAADGIEDTYWADISYEQLLAWDPEWILIPSDASYSVEDVKNDPAVSAVSAVKSGQIIRMPDDIEAWDSPVPGAVLGSLYLSKETGKGISGQEYEETVQEFYGKFYGIEFQ